MMIDFQAQPIVWGEAVNTTVNLNQRMLKDHQMKREYRDGYQAPYPTLYEMLHAFGQPVHNNNCNETLYKAPILHLR